MDAKKISKVLGITENEVNFVLDPSKTISLLTTPQEAESLYQSCPDVMKPAVIEKWNELAIPILTTPQEAESLYQSCPDVMKPAVIEK
ncbi:hypothetical protein ACFLZ0_00005, partial [Patescibacteria group bacterium]